MAEYDAFGRRKGENPLEQLGSSAPAPAPVSVPPPAARRSRALPVLVAVAAVVVMVSIGLSAALLAVGSDEGTAGSVATEAAPGTAASPGGYEPPPGPGQPGPASTARGLEPGSMLTRPVLARAVSALRVTEYGRPLNLRVEATRLDARLVTRKGLMRSVQVAPDGKPREQHAWQGGAIPTMPWDAVDPAAPQRLIRAAAEREGRSAADVNYLVLMPLPDPTWGLFFKDGMHYQGDAAGRILRRVTP